MDDVLKRMSLIEQLFASQQQTIAGQQQLIDILVGHMHRSLERDRASAVETLLREVSVKPTASPQPQQRVEFDADACVPEDAEDVRVRKLVETDEDAGFRVVRTSSPGRKGHRARWAA